MRQNKKFAAQTEDNSPSVHQKGVLKNPVPLRELPWTEKQRDLLELAADKHTQMIIIKGVAGTSKTATAVFSCLQALNDKKVSDIILIRSAVESTDNKLGFLPGPIEFKVGPYLTPFYDKLDMFISPTSLKNLEADERISGSPISFLRGMDWQRKAIILDEAQSLSRKELLTFMTRIGKFCKVFVLGDETQCDIKNSGFQEVFDLFRCEEAMMRGIFTVEFTEDDVMRSDLCKFVSQKFKELPVKR